MKKISSKNVFLVVLVIGIIVLVLVYLYVFSKYNDLTSQLKASNAALREEVNNMKQYYDNIPFYEDEMEAMTAEIGEMIKDYPADTRDVDGIMLAVDVQNAAKINYSSIGIGQNETVYGVAEEDVTAANIENLTRGLNFQEMRLTLSAVTNYDNLKDCIQAIYANPNRIAISNVAFSKAGDDDTNLNGTIDLALYSLTGTDKEYKLPEMPEYESGLSQLFGLAVEKKEE